LDLQKKYSIFAAEFKDYVRKTNEKTQKKDWQPSRCAVDDALHQHFDGLGIVGHGGILGTYLPQSLAMGQGESDGNGDAE
jgi:hypothetical protein